MRRGVWVGIALKVGCIRLDTARREDELARVGDAGRLRSRGVAAAVPGLDWTLTSSSSVSTCSHSVSPSLDSMGLVSDVPSVAFARRELSTLCSKFDIMEWLHLDVAVVQVC